MATPKTKQQQTLSLRNTVNQMVEGPHPQDEQGLPLPQCPVEIRQKPWHVGG